MTTSMTTTTATKRRSATPAAAAKDTVKRARSPADRGVWSADEHDKFLVGIKMFPNGPWKTIAEQIGTRSARQVQTHAQKYYEKVARRLRGLRKHRKKLARPEHRLDDDMMQMCAVATPSTGVDASTLVGLGSIGRGRLDVHLPPLRMALLPPLTMVESGGGDCPVDELKLAICASPLFLTAAKSASWAPVSSAASSPKGVDFGVKHEQREAQTLTHEYALAFALPRRSECAQPFASFLSGGGVDSFVNIDSLDLGPLELDFDLDCSSDAGSDWSSDGASDAASSVGDDTTDVDDTDSVVDLDDRYLDFLMKVLDTDGKQGGAVFLPFES